MEYSTHAATTDAPAIETIHTLLGDRHRRSAVAAIAEREPPISLRELAGTVASREADGGPRGASWERIESIETTLHHAHLPKLDAADVVDYDAETRTVTAARTEELASTMERSFSLDRRA